MEKELMDLFGQALIEKGRDEPIHIALTIIDGVTHTSDLKQVAKLFSEMDESQKEAARRLVYDVVDSVIHNMLYVFEYSKIATIHLHSDGKDFGDMRKIANGDLQGYIFEWAEKYSKQPLTREPLE